MRLVRGLHNLKAFAGGCVATIGNFDGVHCGHQTIIRQLKDKARSLDLPAAVMFFEPQPREFFSGDQAPPRLMRFRDKVEALAALDVDVAVCLQFNRRFRHLSAQEFVDQVLVDGLGVRHLVVGDDFRFGCDRAGDYGLLERQGQQHGFSVAQFDTIEVDGDRVSSTRVRELLQQGDFCGAERLLGRPFSISGRVIHGRQLGRQLGVPTANINLGGKQGPLHGVYLVTAEVDGVIWNGVANLGSRPTIEGGDPVPSLEVHLLDFAGQIYGRLLRVTFLQKLRAEIRFNGLDALKAQIHEDIHQARQYFNQRPSEVAEQ